MGIYRGKWEEMKFVLTFHYELEQGEGVEISREGGDGGGRVWGFVKIS